METAPVFPFWRMLQGMYCLFFPESVMPSHSPLAVGSSHGYLFENLLLPELLWGQGTLELHLQPVQAWQEKAVLTYIWGVLQPCLQQDVTTA